MSKKFRFRGHFEKQHGKRAQTLFKSELPTPKTRLKKCLKCPIAEDPSTSNMVNAPKPISHLHHSTFILFIDHCQGN